MIWIYDGDDDDDDNEKWDDRGRVIEWIRWCVVLVIEYNRRTAIFIDETFGNERVLWFGMWRREGGAERQWNRDEGV